jgi:hypothetical protein
MNQIKAMLDLLVNRFAAISLATVAAALLTYFRAEVAAATKWLLDPLAFQFPWHHLSRQRTPHETPNLTSELTVADVFLVTPDGRDAIYQKTGHYIVEEKPLGTYYEGVTAAGSASGFSTELGAVLETTKEHGFYVSKIDLGSVFAVHARLRNVYRVFLYNSFTAVKEHWTQEIACPTKHLTLRIYFPAGRPPTLIRCKRVIGLTESQISTQATIVDLFGQTAIVWEIERPEMGDIYKLEWRW